MKKYTYTLSQQSRHFEVRAKTKEEAEEILENAEDLTYFEVEPLEIHQKDFEYLEEE